MNASTPIAQLGPDLDTSNTSVKGIVTLVWPYSSSKKSFSILLVEPDFRLRRNKGQVRITFRKSCAKALARAGIASGDTLLLRLSGCKWTSEDTTLQTPGRSAGWELLFDRQLHLQVQTDSGETSTIQVDEASEIPVLDALQEPLTPRTPIQEAFPTSPPSSIRSTRSIESWSSPAFLKKRTFESALAPSSYDVFTDNAAFEDVPATKKLKFGRGSQQWRFVARSPSPRIGSEADKEASSEKMNEPDDHAQSEDREQEAEAGSLLLPMLGHEEPVNATDPESTNITNNTTEEAYHAAHQPASLEREMEIQVDQIIASPPPPAQMVADLDGFQVQSSVASDRVDAKLDDNMETSTQALASSEAKYWPGGLGEQLADLDSHEQTHFSNGLDYSQTQTTDLQDLSQARNDTQLTDQSYLLPVDVQEHATPPTSAPESMQEAFEANGEQGTGEDQAMTAPGHGSHEEELIDGKVSDIDDESENDLHEDRATLASDRGLDEENFTEGEEPESDHENETDEEGCAEEYAVNNAPETFNDDEDKQANADEMTDTNFAPQSTETEISEHEHSDMGSDDEASESEREFHHQGRSIGGLDDYVGRIANDGLSANDEHVSSREASVASQVIELSSDEDSPGSATDNHHPRTSPTGNFQQESGDLEEHNSFAIVRLDKAADAIEWGQELVRGGQKEIPESQPEQSFQDESPTKAPVVSHGLELGSQDSLKETLDTRYPPEIGEGTDGSDLKTTPTFDESQTQVVQHKTQTQPGERISSPELEEIALIPESVQEPHVSLDGALVTHSIDTTTAQDDSSIVYEGRVEGEDHEVLNEYKSSSLQNTEAAQDVTSSLYSPKLTVEELPVVTENTVANIDFNPKANARSRIVLSPGPSQGIGLGRMLAKAAEADQAPTEQKSSPEPRLRRSARHAKHPSPEAEQVEREQHNTAQAKPVKTPRRPRVGRKATEDVDREPATEEASADQPEPMTESIDAAVHQESDVLPTAEQSQTLRPRRSTRHSDRSRTAVELVHDTEMTASITTQLDGHADDAADDVDRAVARPKSTAGKRSTKTQSHIDFPTPLTDDNQHQQPDQVSQQLLQEAQLAYDDEETLPSIAKGTRTKNAYLYPLANLNQQYKRMVDTISIVVGTSKPEKAAVGPRDWHMTLYVTDGSVQDAAQSLRIVQVFRPSKAALPLAANADDVVLLHNFQCRSQRRRPTLLSTDSSGWIIFDSSGEAKSNGPPVEYDDEEIELAIRTHRWWTKVQDEKKMQIRTNLMQIRDAEKEATRRKSGRRLSVKPGAMAHELRDGTVYPYTDTPLLSDGPEHELRDGTVYDDGSSL